MTAVVYTASRSLISGHTVGGVYSLDLSCDSPGGLEPRREVSRRRIPVISGKASEVLRYYGRMEWQVRLAPLSGAALLAVQEFLDSVEDATFTFDPYGTVAVPVAAVSAEIVSDGYAMQRRAPRGNGGASDYFTIGFTVAVIS